MYFCHGWTTYFVNFSRKFSWNCLNSSQTPKRNNEQIRRDGEATKLLKTRQTSWDGGGKHGGKFWAKIWTHHKFANVNSQRLTKPKSFRTSIERSIFGLASAIALEEPTVSDKWRSENANFVRKKGRNACVKHFGWNRFFASMQWIT